MSGLLFVKDCLQEENPNVDNFLELFYQAFFNSRHIPDNKKPSRQIKGPRTQVR